MVLPHRIAGLCHPNEGEAVENTISGSVGHARRTRRDPPHDPPHRGRGGPTSAPGGVSPRPPERVPDGTPAPGAGDSPQGEPAAPRIPPRPGRCVRGHAPGADPAVLLGLARPVTMRWGARVAVPAAPPRPEGNKNHPYYYLSLEKLKHEIGGGFLLAARAGIVPILVRQNRGSTNLAEAKIGTPSKLRPRGDLHPRMAVLQTAVLATSPRGRYLSWTSLCRERISFFFYFFKAGRVLKSKNSTASFPIRRYKFQHLKFAL